MTTVLRRVANCVYTSLYAASIALVRVASTVLSQAVRAAPLVAHGRAPLVVSIEGNIGAGKSTLMSALRDACVARGHGDVVFVEEPAEEWEQRGFLAAFYHGRIDANAFQHAVLMSLVGRMVRLMNAMPRASLVICERSPWGNFETFGKTNLSDDNLTLFEYTWGNLAHCIPPTKGLRVIWLATEDSALLKERVTQRARGSETTVRRDYLEKLESAHRAWLDNCMSPAHVCKVDAGLPRTEVLAHALQAIHKWEAELLGHV